MKSTFYATLTPTARAEFTILGGYTLLCWLISFVGTFWLVQDATGSLLYASLAPVFIEGLAAAGTWLYVAGSRLALTWLRFLVAPALLGSVAHLLAVTTPISLLWQYAVGAGLAVLFLYGQWHVDNALRNTDTARSASRQYALDLARKRLEEDQAEDMARLQLTVATLGHYQIAANTIRDRLLDAVHPAAEYQIAAPAQPVYPAPELVEEYQRGLDKQASVLAAIEQQRVNTDQPASRSVQIERPCRHCGQAGLSQVDLMRHGKLFKAYGQCTGKEGHSDAV